jgi:hypothetical protein
MTGTLRPQVITSVSTSTSFIKPAANKVAAMIGTAQWGPLNEVETISTISEFVSIFGDDTEDGLTGIRGADLFFRNGGTLKFIRIEGASAEASAAASYNLEKSAADLIDVTAKYTGTYGDNIRLVVTANGSNRDLMVTDGKSIELYTNSGSGYATSTALMAAVNERSNLITAALHSGADGANLPDAADVFLAGGDDGATVAITDYSDALADYLYSEEFQYLLVPGVTLDADLDTLASALVVREAQERKLSSLISGIDVDETLTTAAARSASSGTKRLRLVAPNVVYTERYGNTELVLDGSYLACAVAGLLCSLNYSESATHKTLSVDDLSILKSSGKKYYNKIEQEQALQIGLLPVSLIGQNIQVVRDITRIGDSTSVYFAGSITDIVDYITVTLESYLDKIIGMPSNSLNRSAWASQCNSILEQMLKDNIITEFLPTVVAAGTSVNSINVTVSVKPVYSVDFVYLTITM